MAHGFDEVTISQVADAAGVAKMTVTNYFPRKEDLVFDRAETVIGHLADVVASRKPGETMLTAIRRDYAVAATRGDVTLGLSSPAFARMIAGSPVLTTRELEMLDQREQALGDAIAAETGYRRPAAAAGGGPARLGAPRAVRRGQPAQPGGAAARADLCRAGRRRHPRVRPARAVPRPLRHPAPGTVAAVQPGAPRRRVEQGGQHPHGGGLARPVRPEQGEHAARSAAVSDPGQRLGVPEALGQPLGLDHVGFRAPLSLVIATAVTYDADRARPAR